MRRARAWRRALPTRRPSAAPIASRRRARGCATCSARRRRSSTRPSRLPVRAGNAIACLALLAASGAAAEEPVPAPRDPARDVEQRRPGSSEPRRYVPPPADPSQVPPPLPALPRETLPVPDRWRIMRGLGMNSPWFDPYNQNLLKGDLPVVRDWFVNVGVVSDTLAEFRALPIPVGAQTTQGPDSLDTFGRGRQSTLAQTFVVSI